MFCGSAVHTWFPEARRNSSPWCGDRVPRSKRLNARNTAHNRICREKVLTESTLARRCLLAAILCSLHACTATVSQRPTYIPLHATVHGDRDHVLHAVWDTVAARGLRLVQSDAAAGSVMALSPVDHSAGVETRERWRFTLGQNDVEVELRAEMKTAFPGNGGWRHTDFVCECYRYAREREMIHQIRRRLRTAMLSPQGF
jgi:hypothetical protein